VSAKLPPNDSHRVETSEPGSHADGLSGVALQLDPATENDAELLFEWRNDPVTRENSIVGAPVTWEGHIAWLQASLTNPNRHILLGSAAGCKVGMVRLDINDDGTCELSWTVAPDLRGRGFGKALVAKALERTRSPVVARIKIDNLASIAIAKACGFQLQSEQAGLSTWLRRD
jgi:RimJ/RimL family protein N-acetyltransferase